VKSTKVLVLS